MEDVTKKDYLLIIDGSALLSTQFYGNLPKEIVFAKTLEEKERYFGRIMQTKDGVYTNAVYGFMRVLMKVIREQTPSHLAITWDVGRNTFRRKIYPDYKGNRGETLEPLRQQFILCQEVLKAMNIKQFMDEQYEADDFSGTLAKKFEEQLPVRIMTKDNDYLQLISDNTNIWMIHTTAKKTEELYKKYNLNQKKLNIPDRTFPFDRELLEAETMITPESITSLKALQGDASDNIKGVPGVGEVTAQILMSHYKTIENLYNEIRCLDEAGKKKISEYWKTNLLLKRSPISYLLKESDTEIVGEKAAILSKELATIKTDIELDGLSLNHLGLKLDKSKAKEEFERLEFKSLTFEDDTWQTAFYNPFDEPVSFEEELEKTEIDSNVESSLTNKISETEYKFISRQSEWTDTINNIINDSRSKKTGTFSHFAFSFFNDCDTIYGAGITISQNETFYISFMEDINENIFVKELKRLTNEGFYLTCYQLKKLLNHIKDIFNDSNGYKGIGCFDVEIAAYLLNPLKGSYPLDEICGEYLKDTLPKTNETELLLMYPKDAGKKAACESNAIYHLREKLNAKLNKNEMSSLLNDIEMPLVFTLYDIEKIGIQADHAKLMEYGSSLASGIIKLEESIHELAGEEFNINSPKQLGVILFEKMKLPNGKKTKTGFSTSADVLEKIEDKHPIIGKILEYRQLTKLKSTYADGLLGYILEDGRIHTSLNQTVTATGRLSSTEPNLQNIPIRLELGRQIRRVFTPKEGYVFIDADYSQIELRILAHMSGDEKLIKAYNEAQDIHRITASQVFHIPLDMVTNEQRSSAKAVNFGIVYGISSFGLGQGLNISRHEADEYITRYFKTYPRVKEFLDELIENGRKDGYVSTIFKRRRPVTELNHKNFNIRSQEERIAMNSPIQGTAADIIKIAMNRVSNRLRQEKLKSRLILQVHDELIAEALIEEKDIVKKIMMEEMKNAAELKVVLEVDIKEGTDWYAAK